MNLFALLSGGLSVEEHLRFDLGREGDRLTVLVQPILKAAPPDLADERQRLRGALAHPLWLAGTPEQLDRERGTALAEYGAHRRDQGDQIIDRLVALLCGQSGVFPLPLQLVEDGVLGFLSPVVKEHVLPQGSICTSEAMLER